MVLSLKEVKTSTDKDKFIRLPWKIYGDSLLWVPPLISERKRFLDPKVNPFFKDSKVDLFLAVSNNQTVVGRVAFIENYIFNKSSSEQIGFFGMFEVVKDKQASDLLLDKAEEWCREKKFSKLVGPVNLSTNQECGLLIDGFDTPPVIGITYNPRYYSEFFESWGLKKYKDLVSLRMNMPKMPEYLESAMRRISKRQRFKVRPFRLNNFNEEIENIWHVYNESWADNWGFIPMSKEEFVYSASEMRDFIRPEYCFIAEVDGKPVGFSLTLPDINAVLKKMNGRIFPFGWAKFFLNKNRIKLFRVVALGVMKKYRRLGIDVAFYYETYKNFLEKKIKWCDMSWVLEDNKGMLGPLYRLGGTIYKRHRIYERNILS
jgi:GNAT superfamily N-acetyltransferase